MQCFYFIFSFFSLLWKIPPLILSPITLQPCLKVTLQSKRSEGHWREVPGTPFPIHPMLSSQEPWQAELRTRTSYWRGFRGTGARGGEAETGKCDSVPCIRIGWAVPRESHSYICRQNGSHRSRSNNNLEVSNHLSNGKSHLWYGCQKSAVQY